MFRATMCVCIHLSVLMRPLLMHVQRHNEHQRQGASGGQRGRGGRAGEACVARVHARVSDLRHRLCSRSSSTAATSRTSPHRAPSVVCVIHTRYCWFVYVELVAMNRSSARRDCEGDSLLPSPHIRGQQRGYVLCILVSRNSVMSTLIHQPRPISMTCCSACTSSRSNTRKLGGTRYE